MDLKMLLLMCSITFAVVWCADEMKMKIKGALTATGTMKNFAKDSNKTVHIVTEIKNMLNGMCEYGEKNDNLSEMNDKIDQIHSAMKDMKRKMNTIEDLARDIRNQVVDKTLPRECKDKSTNRNGVYKISPDGSTKFKVKCESGGWTIIQKRFNGKTKFYRNWKDYESGFGDLNGEFWLGNKYIALLTSSGTHELRVDLEDWSGNKAYAVYKNFKVGDASTKYKLTVSGYSGTAGDSLSYHNGQYFSTFDQDNDRNSINCAAAVSVKGAWWYNSCYRSSLNGIYTNGSHSNAGIKWHQWKRSFNSLKKSSMMIRKV